MKKDFSFLSFIFLIFFASSCTSTVKIDATKITKFTSEHYMAAALSPLLAFNECLNLNRTKPQNQPQPQPQSLKSNPDLAEGNFTYRVSLKEEGHLLVENFKTQSAVKYPSIAECEKNIELSSNKLFMNYSSSLGQKYGMSTQGKMEIETDVNVKKGNKVSGAINSKGQKGNLELTIHEPHQEGIDVQFISPVFTQAFLNVFFERMFHSIAH